MARRLDPAKIAAKFKKNASMAGDDYVEGAKNPRRNWKDAAIDGEAAYAAAMERVIREGRRAKAVRRTDERAYIDGIVSKGRRRYSEGIAASEDKYRRNMEPYLGALEVVQDELPPRGPKGSPENYERVRFIGETLHQLKEELAGE